MLINLILLLICIGLSAFFSCAETAFVTARRIKFLVWIKQNRKGAKKVYDFLQKPQKYLATTLVGTNVGIVGASVLFTMFLHDSFTAFQITLISSAILLVLGEIIPKFIGSRLANTIALYSYQIHQVSYYIFSPIIWVVQHVSQLVLKLLRIQSDSVDKFFSRDDLNILVHEGEETGVINVEERQKISRMILRGRKTIHEVMIPRTEIAAVDKEASVRDAAQLFMHSGFSRLPVFDGDIDHIIGMVYLPDIIYKNPEFLYEIKRDVLYVPETLNMIALLHSMRRRGVTMAIAVDEYGGTSGLVTIEDMVEEFFGDIEDEYDDSSNLVHRVGPTRMDVNARIDVDDLNERFDLGLPEGDYQTLGGLIINELGRIPRRGEKINLGDYTLIVLAAQEEKVNRVRILRVQNRELKETQD